MLCRIRKDARWFRPKSRNSLDCMETCRSADKEPRGNTSTEKGLNRGDKFFWDVYSNVGTQGRRLDETGPIPETGFTVQQHSLTVFEAGNSVH